ncbi:MAG TPA: twin-arginine translocase TatA/TatE family subunit [Bacteroidia bacterium]|jgi:sec-independent protein translocase protein TatA|nr:twin-arginine translocase TatA/TatE family subunit [Bacteroidia bacterium]
MLLFLDAIKPGEIVLILVIVLVFFGGKKIPELMRGLGQGIKEFKDASKNNTDNDSSKKSGDTTTGQIK